MIDKTICPIGTFRKADEHLANRISKTSLLKTTKTDWRIRRLNDEEITIGRVLGRGNYCVVHEVEITKNGTDGKQQLIRASSKENSKQSSPFPYVIKRLDVTGAKKPSFLLQGMVDLAYEAALISSLSHPNIISVEGISTHSPSEGSQFFVIFSRLVEFLGHRIKAWKKLQNRGVFHLLTDRKHKKETALLVERLKCASGIASAVCHLHKSNIMHRDIKPDNIGFDKDGVVKVTDFGLAREYNPANRQADGTFYHLTEETGTMLYMDPRVMMGCPYNESCDVFSFSVLLWQIMALRQPFEGYNLQLFQLEIVGKGRRLKVRKAWPKSVQKILKCGWDEDYLMRPSMQTIYERLEKEIEKQSKRLR